MHGFPKMGHIACVIKFIYMQGSIKNKFGQKKLLIQSAYDRMLCQYLTKAIEKRISLSLTGKK